MSKIWSALAGKKTYLLALGAAVYAVGIQAGWWHESHLADMLLLAGGGATLRHAIGSVTDEGDNGGNKGNFPQGQSNGGQ